jgi:glycerophosphoryl diester phosphodiesterase
MVAALSMPSRPQVHGHRGCRGLRPENTLAAFLHALELGVDVLELDVVISNDHQVVVSHEPWMAAQLCLTPAGQRILPAQENQHNLYQLPYATIRQYDCGQLQHPDFPAQLSGPAHKPLLSEVLAAVEAATRFLGRAPVGYSVEIKSSAAGDRLFHPAPAEFLDLVLTELHAAQVLPRCTLLSFDSRVLQLAHARVPSLASCLLLEAEQPWFPSLEVLGFVPVSLGPDYTTISAAAVQELRTRYPGLRLAPWTVNEPADMHQLWTWGVDSITTDYPDRLLAVLG